MGPSWYWMPDIAENFFNVFAKSSLDFYDLKKISPSFRIFFEKDDYWDVPSEPEKLYDFFERTETGAAKQLQKFMKQASFKYDAAMKHLLYMPSLTWSEYLKWPLMKGFLRYSLFTSFGKHVRSYFKHPRLIHLMEFPVFFLGASPKKIPALYSLMNYSGFIQGTWYPMGGMYKMIEAIRQIAVEKGAKIFTSSEINEFTVNASSITNCKTKDTVHECEAVIASTDYHHIDQHVLQEPHRSYSEKYWNSRIMAPSYLIFYIGVNKKIPNILHHNLFLMKMSSSTPGRFMRNQNGPPVPYFISVAPPKLIYLLLLQVVKTFFS